MYLTEIYEIIQFHSPKLVRRNCLVCGKSANCLSLTGALSFWEWMDDFKSAGQTGNLLAQPWG